MQIYLDDSSCKENLIPFSLTRDIAECRIGVLTIKEKWQLLLNNEFQLIDGNHHGSNVIVIPSNIIPTKKNYKKIIHSFSNNIRVHEDDDIKYINYPWHIFQWNDWCLRNDFELLTASQTSKPVSDSNKIIGDVNAIFLEEGVNMEHCILNTTTGPIYIGRNAVIMEGSMIRGPFSLGERSIVKMGSRIYGATTVGSNCVVGGEIKNSVLFDNSNKAHDGYLGDSVIGAWCNLGAGTSSSNVKNTGGEVKYKLGKDIEPMSCGFKGGLLMGDYSRCAINTSFNTGTTVGVCCNIFGNDYPEKYIDHFSWGAQRYVFEKVIKDIDNWKKMKNQNISDPEIEMLKKLFYH